MVVVDPELDPVPCDPEPACVPVEGGCFWPSLPYSCCPEIPEADPCLVERMERAAVGWLFRQTGCRFFGSGCKTMLRPPTDCCQCDICCCVGWSLSQPIHIAPPGVCVEQVHFWWNGCLVNGEGEPQNVRLAESAEGIWAVNTSGPWPGGQDFGADPTREGSCCAGGSAWGLEVEYSADPPQIVLEAAAALVCHLVCGCPTGGDEDCCSGDAGIPKGVEQYSTGGVTYTLGNLSRALFSDGRTGIELVDLALWQFPPPTAPVALVDPSVGAPLGRPIAAPSLNHRWLT